jgi:hypothetical protein
MNFKKDPALLQLGKLPILCCAALLLFATACKKDDPAKTPHQEINEVTEEGTPTETPKTAVIGVNGGKLVSRDGKLEINIPAGALSANTTIGVASITNTSSAGFGLNYRLTPHMNFNNPVKLTFSYAGSEDSIGNTAGLGITYRDEQGVWQLKRRSKLDAANKKISVETDHFSDWAASRLIKVSPSYSEIEPGGSVIITPVACVALKEIFDLDKVFNPNGPDASLPIVESYELPADYVVDMYVVESNTEGVGTLEPVSISSAEYTASADVDPVANPVNIAFILTTRTVNKTLLSRVKVKNYNHGVYITLNGKEYNYDATATVSSTGLVEIEFTRTINNEIIFYGAMAWRGGIGTHQWDGDNDFWWEPEDLSPKRVYQHLFNDGMTVSGGNIRVSSLESPGGWVIGTFSIQNSGATNTESGNAEYLGASKVEGGFRVKREY